jgi:hypothetical protein
VVVRHQVDTTNTAANDDFIGQAFEKLQPLRLSGLIPKEKIT